MSQKRTLSDVSAENLSKRDEISQRAVESAEKFINKGKYGRALPRLFKYEDYEPKAMYLLGIMYFEGLGVIQDMGKGADYMQSLIDCEDFKQGEEIFLSMALFLLGELYYKGVCLAKDNAKAERLWLRGAWLPKSSLTGLHYLGSVKCQTSLGMYYSHPDMIDADKAFYWHSKAQASGSVISEAALGVMYMFGYGIQENPDLAYRHLLTAAVQDNTYAKGYLAAFYYRSRMYQRTVTLGKELASLDDYQSVAKASDCPVEHVIQGAALGCFYLALCCQNGFVVPKDLVIAKQLIIKAIELYPTLALDLHVRAILGTA